MQRWIKNVLGIYLRHTESVIIGNNRVITEIINKSGLKIANAHIVDDKVQLKNWPHIIGDLNDNRKVTAAKYILLGEADKKRFKLVDTFGDIIYVKEGHLKGLIELGRILNCTYKESDDTYKSIDTYKIKADPEFTASTAKRYKEFKLKTKLLGIDISFKYTIEGEDVKITEYTGTSKRVIIPNFVTTIGYEAFINRGIEELSLNIGLKHIANSAFERNNIKYLKIPETVEFIWGEAFKHNEVEKTLKKLNPNILIID